MNRSDKETVKTTGGIVIAFVVIVILLSSGYLGWRYVYVPRFANVERQAFKQTRSYVDGKLQDLSRYYRQYEEADSDGDRQAIRSFINLEFAEFDEKHITNEKLRVFLIEMRGF